MFYFLNILPFSIYFVNTVCERCLDNNELLMDDSAWLEIAKYQQCSLLMRVDPLPGEPISFDQGCTYGGYSDSNAQISVNRWFERLKPEVY